MQYQINPVYQVEPTAQGKTEHYSDIALTGLFNTHVSLLTQEVQGIWRRYNVMLLANAVILGFFTRAQTPSMPEISFATIFGILLPTGWLIITVKRWFYFEGWFEAAGQFKWTGLNGESNPIPYVIMKGGTKRDVIFWTAVLTIILFMLSYIFLSIYHVFLK